MEHYEYIRIKIKADLIPDDFKTYYKLHDKIHNGYIYCKIRRGMYGLPQKMQAIFRLSVPKDRQPIRLNGAVDVLCTVLKFVAASAAEAELGALLLYAKQAKILRLTLEEMGHPQPPTPIHIDNSTTVGIVNNKIKRQKSRSMEMRYFWLLDAQNNELFDFKYHPGLENLADYPSKHHSGSHHMEMRPYYVHYICQRHQDSYLELTSLVSGEGVLIRVSLYVRLQLYVSILSRHLHV
jgi:hypothetical protein